jgi:hypothetical protein
MTVTKKFKQKSGATSRHTMGTCLFPAEHTVSRIAIKYEYSLENWLFLKGKTV